MKINIFQSRSVLYPFRWFVCITLVVMGFMVYANLTGRRLLASSNQQQWNAGGANPGGHK